MLPALIIGHANCETVKKRVEELRAIGIHEIFVYVDGYNFNGHINMLQQRTELIEMLEKEMSLAKLSGVYFCETNSGVGIAVPAAVDWFFQKVDFGLILEDDCSLLPHAKKTLDYFNSSNPLLNDSVICLSSPLSTTLKSSEIDKIDFIESQFFTSWGWICLRETWERIALRKISLIEVLNAAFLINNITWKSKFWLCLSWSDIWFSLKKNQRRLWAFRFTILLILSGVKIYYPASKAVQHIPNEYGTNVRAIPEWDNHESKIIRPLKNLTSSEIQISKSLDVYLVKTIQGASFISLFTRFAFKFARKVKIR